ncbi:MAG TPA: hypothetical protein VFV38_43245 [Ktedonobacteraceae bacterium]|nr:hypothetical protein [Ktedonobacteraceae bacterium]
MADIVFLNAQQDERYVQYLKNTARDAGLSAWSISDTRGGTDHAQVLQDNINAAKMIVPIGSADFLAGSTSGGTRFVDVVREAATGPNPKPISVLYLRSCMIENLRMPNSSVYPDDAHPITLITDRAGREAEMIKFIHKMTEKIRHMHPPAPSQNIASSRNQYDNIPLPSQLPRFNVSDAPRNTPPSPIPSQSSPAQTPVTSPHSDIVAPQSADPVAQAAFADPNIGWRHGIFTHQIIGKATKDLPKYAKVLGISLKPDPGDESKVRVEGNDLITLAKNGVKFPGSEIYAQGMLRADTPPTPEQQERFAAANVLALRWEKRGDKYITSDFNVQRYAQRLGIKVNFNPNNESELQIPEDTYQRISAVYRGESQDAGTPSNTLNRPSQREEQGNPGSVVGPISEPIGTQPRQNEQQEQNLPVGGESTPTKAPGLTPQPSSPPSTVISSTPSPVSVFFAVCDTPKDKKLADEIIKYTQGLLRKKITLTQGREAQQMHEGGNPQVIVICLSPDSVNDPAINKLIQEAMELKEQSGTKVIPLIIRNMAEAETPAAFQKRYDLNGLQNLKPAYLRGNRDKATAEAAGKIGEVVDIVRMEAAQAAQNKEVGGHGPGLGGINYTSMRIEQVAEELGLTTSISPEHQTEPFVTGKAGVKLPGQSKQRLV